jgi:hypothetical protein
MMPNSAKTRGPRALWGSAAAGVVGVCSLALAPQPPTAFAQPSPNQPDALDSTGLTPPPCPLIVPKNAAALQPVRIKPSEVPLKNQLGCLSQEDAIYGADGCPRQLCTKATGIPLPPF